MRLVLSTFLSLGLAATAFAAELAAPQGRVLLTVAGDLPAGNTDPLKPEAVNVSGFLGIEYDKAVAFDDAMLSGLSQHEIAAKLLDTGREVTYSGPRLSDVLAAAGAEGKLASPTALDGYSAELSWDTIKQHEPILATHADGRPLEIGKLGPAMIVFPVIDDKEAYAEFSAMEVFATFYIGIE
ncbi:hypothetical protein AIOL_001963 [Candidatus Rhodobacter oscarellae]|uniref:Oxidoreductase molybdopterin-binding domain-containing protein n=1 Tax=Candidatus Rhodobacter oscarellae TaxID=1675527 RepID=A0A0J9E2N8_9RHOB|nr:hypothetical protein [Candidatus Rhodobacter lobularis]KMW57005.1 hypothetical protein AIOL_001963 [Candidatus Rhodobacter lobularis]